MAEWRHIIGKNRFMSGEIVYTYYFSEYNPKHPDYGAWAFWKLCDWVGSKPEPTNLVEIESVGLAEAWRRLKDSQTPTVRF